MVPLSSNEKNVLRAFKGENPIGFMDISMRSCMAPSDTKTSLSSLIEKHLIRPNRITPSYVFEITYLGTKTRRQLPPTINNDPSDEELDRSLKTLIESL